MKSDSSVRNSLTIAVIWHYFSYIIMQTLALLAETRRGPALRDILHDLLPQISAFNFFNTSGWLTTLILFLIYLAFRHREVAINYLWIGGVVSIFRGIFISLTTLGPPEVHRKYIPEAMKQLTISQIDFALLFRQWMPLDIFSGGSGMSAAYLTQDLFFSGHTSASFLFILVSKTRGQFIFALVYHIITILALLFTKLHYTIDILGAYFIVYAVYAYFEKKKLLL